MNQLKNPSRRTFLKTSAAAGGGLMLGVVLPDAIAAMHSSAAPTAMNAWIRVGSDNSVTILSARSEMGQGGGRLCRPRRRRAEVDLGKIKIEIAPPGEVYINAMLGGQLTGGSTSVAEAYDKLRTAGAQARTMLVQAAAQKWNVDAADCHAKNGSILGPKGKKATYGELADAASSLPVPKEVKLKEHKDSRYVGKPVRRIDTPSKVNGSAGFGIDVKLPGMLYASLAQCPVIGGKVASFNATKARTMPGLSTWCRSPTALRW
jgi:isoquinoline 1-oxidoreductase beta subunit